MSEPEAASADSSGSPDSPGLGALIEAVATMDRLRSPGGCPWDAEQTHASLAPYAVEEAHELAEAAESGDREHLIEELGDVLLQVLFHARIGSEGSLGEPFDIDDVARRLVAKLTARHPHVFTGGTAGSAGDEGGGRLTAADVNQQWDRLKADEKQRESVLEGIPVSMPALARTQKVLRRAARAGLAVPEPGEDVGGRLQAAVEAAEERGLDAEAALRAQLRVIEDGVRAAESAAAAEGREGDPRSR
ncbi:MazG family protein [Ruania suaedae]|uniref:MazG family protein n=1 Tax=Ruania suaedae TaxID=2897774 RepID=UPI001E5E5518|nr:MazG family protein [Ruania suaedae]UFU03823.1 MazG family protein [Ruania suaedae]